MSNNGMALTPQTGDPLDSSPASTMEQSLARPSRDMAISVRGLCKSHGTKKVLKDVSFEARPGMVTAFLGPNGAGKSSTLRILAGLDRPDAGRAIFDGREYRSLTRPLTVAGFQFDGPGGAASRRVETHLRILAASNGLPRQRVAAVLDEVEMTDKQSARLGTLSLGEGQRIALAAALLGDPQYLVLDEPTNGLDPVGIRWFRRFVIQHARSGKTVLLSSHMLSEVEMVADEIVIINHGSIVSHGPLSSIREHLESLEELFFSVTNGGE